MLIRPNPVVGVLGVLGVVVVLVVVFTVSCSRIKGIRQSRKVAVERENLRIDVTFVSQHGRTPQERITVYKTRFACPLVFGDDIPRMSPPKGFFEELFGSLGEENEIVGDNNWYEDRFNDRWCDKNALNTPTDTDASGRMTLWFEPPPYDPAPMSWSISLKAGTGSQPPQWYPFSSARRESNDSWQAQLRYSIESNK